MDRIIICYEQDDNLDLGIKLINILPNANLHIKSRFDVANDALSDEYKLTYFGETSLLNSKEIILNESLRASAKQLHEHYRTKYPSIGEWESLSSVLINSNISAGAAFII